MLRLTRRLVLIGLLAALIAGWKAFRAARNRSGYESLARQAGLDHRIPELNLHSCSFIQAARTVADASGVRIEVVGDPKGKLQVEAVREVRPIHLRLRDVKVSAALGLLQDVWSNLELQVVVDPGPDGVIRLRDRNTLPQVVRVYHIDDLLSQLDTPKSQGTASQPAGKLSGLIDTILMYGGQTQPRTYLITDSTLVFRGTLQEQAEIFRALEGFRQPTNSADAGDALLNKLDVMVGPLDLHGASNEEAIGRLGQEAGVNLAVDWTIFDPDELHQSHSQNLSSTNHLARMSLRAAMERLFTQTDGSYGMPYTVEDNVLIAGDSMNSACHRRTAKSYDVSDLVAAFAASQRGAGEGGNSFQDGSVATEALITLIKLVPPRQIDISNESIERIVAGKARLFVVATDQGQRQVSDVLETLRRMLRGGSAHQPARPSFLAPCAAAFAQLQRNVPDLRLERASMAQALTALESASGVPIVLALWERTNPPFMQRAVTLRLENVPFRVALLKIMDPAKTFNYYGLCDDVVVVGGWGPHCDLPRVYDVRGITANFALLERLSSAPQGGTEPDALGELRASTPLQRLVSHIAHRVDPTSWTVHHGIVDQAREFAGLLVITQTPENHMEIEALLEELGRR